jgi:hypothetical protein
MNYQQEYWNSKMTENHPTFPCILSNKLNLLSNDNLPEVTWKSRDNPNKSVLEDDNNIEGDHITIKAEMESENLSIIKTEMLFHGRSPLNITRSLVYVHHESPESQNDFDWLIVENIAKGLKVELTINFSNTNCDIYAWWNNELDTDA